MKAAEADAESRYLSGLGVARQRKVSIKYKGTRINGDVLSRSLFIIKCPLHVQQSERYAHNPISTQAIIDGLRETVDSFSRVALLLCCVQFIRSFIRSFLGSNIDIILFVSIRQPISTPPFY